MTAERAAWNVASRKVREFAARYGVTDIYWGTGYPIYKPHAVASTLDAWSGQGMGYFVRVYPKGDGYQAQCHATTIYLSDCLAADRSGEDSITSQELA